MAYDADLVATGGNPPYAWQFDPIAGLQLDSETGHLSGTPLGAGQRSLSVRVRDSAGNAVEASLSLNVRASCWFAYLSKETGSARLHVVDTGLSVHKLFPASVATDEQVLDFKFSPDGHFLAFRSSVQGTTPKLRLARTDAAADTVLPFAHPVLDYTWSDDAQSLAVVLAGDDLDHHFLSGLNVDDTGHVWPERDTIYRGDLQWAGHAAVLYLGQAVVDLPGDPPSTITLPDLQSPYVASVMAQALEPPRQISAIQLTQARLYGFSAGFMTHSLEAPARIDGFEIGSSAATDVTTTFTLSSMSWSENHRYVASLDQSNRFGVYTVVDASTPLATSTSRCDAVLAWRSLSDRERAICIDATVTGCDTGTKLAGGLRVFDFFTASHRLDEHLVGGCYQVVHADENPHMLSRSGGVFVFDVASNFTVVGLTNTSLRFGSLIENADQRGYAVSPDDRAVLVQIGERLTLLELNSPGDLVPISADDRPALAADPCSAVFADEQDGWCGTGNLRSALWAPDATSIVYQAKDGVLWLADVSVPNEPPEIHQLSASAICPNGCISSYAYQPTPALSP